MKFRSPLAIVALTIVICCKPASDSDSTSAVDSLIVNPDSLSFAPDEGISSPPVVINYYWQEQSNDDNMFEPMKSIYNEAQAAIKVRDSMYFAHEPEAFTAGDSALLKPLIDNVYQSILRYAKQMKTAVKIPRTKRPIRNNALQPEDESFGVLPESMSKTLDKVDFMFLGMAPFVEMDPEVNDGPAGEPEVFYKTNIAENTVFFFEYLYSIYPADMNLAYGPPIQRYEGTDAEINGIGSISHNLSERIPVWFLTREGVFPASLLSVNIRLGWEYGCVSNDPSYLFACSKNLDPADIFGVFVSDNDDMLKHAQSKSSRSSTIWEYDLDGDGQSDIVQVSSRSEGASGDLQIAIWYARINGEWQVLDYASQPDCT